MVDEYDSSSHHYLFGVGERKGVWGEYALGHQCTAFFGIIKALMDLQYGVKMVFMTGITPLLVTQSGSGFNITSNISREEGYAGVCGLTNADVLDALALACKEVKDPEEKRNAVQKQYEYLTAYANGYCPCPSDRTEPF